MPASDDARSVASSGSYNASYGPSNAFDDDSATMWISQPWLAPAWIQLNVGSPAQAVSAYEIRFANGSELTTRAPNEWQLLGSDDGRHWVEVDSRHGQDGWSGSETRPFDTGNDMAFTWYRLVVHRDNDDRASIVAVSIADLKFYTGCSFHAPPPPPPPPPPTGPELEVRLDAATAPAHCPQRFDTATDGPGQPLTVHSGDPVTLCVQIMNFGQTDAATAHIEIVGLDAVVLPATLGPVPAGQSIAHVFNRVASLGDSTVVAQLAYLDENGAKTTDRDSAVLDVVGAPQLEVALTIASDVDSCPASFSAAVVGPGEYTAAVGDNVAYCYNLRNIGDGPATSVSIAHPALVNGSTMVPDLAPGDDTLSAAAWVFGIGPDEAGSSTATVSYSSIVGAPQPAAWDEAVLHVVSPPPPPPAVCAANYSVIRRSGPDHLRPFSSPAYSAEYTAPNAFDGEPSTRWISKPWDHPVHLGTALDIGSITVTAYEIGFSNGAHLATRAPRRWALQGSNDGASWTTVDKQTEQTGWAGSETRQFNVAEPGDFSIYRLLIVEDNDDRASIVAVSISELDLFTGCRFPVR